MSTLLRPHAKVLSKRIELFSQFWNEKDLDQLSTFITENIEFTNPPINFGFFRLDGKTIVGKFNLLKFWDGFFRNNEHVDEEKVIKNIEQLGDDYYITCLNHNLNFGISAQTLFVLNEELLIKKIVFNKITKFKEDKELSVAGILIRQIKSKYFN